MPFVSVTRLRLRSAWYLLPFIGHTYLGMRQTQHAPGFLDGQLAGGPGRTFWTLTVWRDEADMKAFRVAGAHKRAMPRLLDWCDEAAVAHWTQPDAALPTLPDALARLVELGRTSKVRHPTPAHAAGDVAPDRQPPLGGTRLRSHAPA
jgi:hypothetical protein